ncbi:hypothetical protein [Lentzea sp. NPDC051838]|uniref:hypothetical protein n=1 Tax=Lentzea sp. NPDC051838 TaxID=3154849 RepID=UPI0034181A09
MTDLAAALLRLSDAFPDDPGPAHDPFEIKDRFDIFVWHGPYVFVDDFDMPAQMRIWAPRILRLLTSGELTYTRVIAPRFAQCGWPGWPPHRRTAVEDVLRAWWAATLSTHPSPIPVTGVLTVVSQLSGGVEPWLATWSAVGGVAAARHLGDLLHDYLPWSSFVDDFDQEAAQDAIRAWLLRDGVDLLLALPPGEAQDSALAELAELEDKGLWWLPHQWW